MRLIAFATCLLMSQSAWAQDLDATPPVGEVQTSWRVEVSSVSSDTVREQRLRSVRYGPDWASWVTGQGAHMWLDLSERALYAQPQDETDIIRTSLYAEARRHLDIYVALSEGGRREVISFGPAGTFDRVWLEAATGVASQGSALTLTDTPTGFIALYNDQLVFSADYGGAETACEAPAIEAPQGVSARAWLPYVTPIHPDCRNRPASPAPSASSFTALTAPPGDWSAGSGSSQRTRNCPICRPCPPIQPWSRRALTG